MGKEYKLVPSKIPNFYENLEKTVDVDVINISWHKCIDIRKEYPVRI